MPEETIQAYPLQWPAGWRRVPAAARKRAQFSKYKADVTVAEGAGRIMEQLRRMNVGDWNIIVSTNVKPRLDGLPSGNQGEPKDPGAAVYWQHGKAGHRCMAVDRYDRVADNLAAIAATLEAMRAIERHGGAQILDRAFVGFKQLMAAEQWFQVLGLDGPDVTAEQIQEAWREKAKQHHPDRGGEDAHMARINAARDRGLEELALGVGR